jgi:hypothetical protein
MTGVYEGPFAVRLVGPTSAAAAARLRLEPGLEVHVGDGGLWLRGPSAGERLCRELAALPADARFHVDAQGDCRRPGQRIPVARLPAGPWLPIRSWGAPALPGTALPGRPPAAVVLQVVRGGAEQPANAQWTTLARLGAFAGRAADVRLRALRMAVGADGRVLVHGVPLLPLPGPALVERDGIALPAGCRFEPELEPAVVAQRLGLLAGDVAAFDERGQCDVLPASGFVMLCRSAVRATAVRLGPP